VRGLTPPRALILLFCLPTAGDVRYHNDASDHWRTLLPAGYDDASVHVAAVHDDDHHVHIPSHNAHHHVDADASTDDEEGGRQEGLEY
jgi:hypothetical protein